MYTGVLPEIQDNKYVVYRYLLSIQSDMMVYYILSPSSSLFLHHPSGRSRYGTPIWVRTAKDSTSIHYPLWDVIRKCGELKSLITQVINPTSELDFTTTAGLIIISHIKDSAPIITPNFHIYHIICGHSLLVSFIYIFLSIIDQPVVYIYVFIIVLIWLFFVFLSSVFGHWLCPLTSTCQI